MPRQTIRACRMLVVLVIYWLLGVYVVNMFAGTFRRTLGWLWGLLWMLVMGGLLWFIRWRAERALGAVERRWVYYAWWCVPTLVTIAPFLWKTAHWLARKDAPKGFLATAGASLGALFPVFVELGVPVLVLTVVAYELSELDRKPSSGPPA